MDSRWQFSRLVSKNLRYFMKNSLLLWRIHLFKWGRVAKEMTNSTRTAKTVGKIHMDTQSLGPDGQSWLDSCYTYKAYNVTGLGLVFPSCLFYRDHWQLPSDPSAFGNRNHLPYQMKFLTTQTQTSPMTISDQFCFGREGTGKIIFVGWRHTLRHTFSLI